jgi:penicillin-binding protein 1A
MSNYQSFFNNDSKKEQPNQPFGVYIKIIWGVTGLLIVSTIVFFWLISIGKLGFMPSFDELENPQSLVATEIITADGKQLGKYFKTENRSLVKYEELSPNLVTALIATEDERYYKHSGIDVRGFIRVIKGIVTRDLSSGGGSTISQQLSKLLFPRENNSGLKFLVRKFREWVIAVKLERSYTKEEIITMYLNKFEFIYGAFGVKVAAQTYFNTTPDSLDIHQAAMLVGMLKNPFLYNPTRFEERATNRRNVVLSQMLKNRYINRDQFDSIKTLPLDIDFNRSELKEGIAPYFRKYLERTMIAVEPIRSNYGNTALSRQRFLEDSVAWHNDPLYGWCNKNLKPDGQPFDLYKDGLKIYTTINFRMQQYAEEAVEEHLKLLQPQLDRHVRNNRNAPFSDDLSTEAARQNLMNEVYRSNRYRTLKEKGVSHEKIMSNFNELDTIRVYTWNDFKDTIMSPMDSIKYYLRHLSSSFMAMEPASGAVRAWVGGSAYHFTEIDMVRSSTYKRQVGSTCKPFLYTLAMQNGLSPCLKVPNVEQTFILPEGGTWAAKNASKTEYDGDMVTLPTR